MATYATVGELADYVRSDGSDSDHLTLALEAATEAVDLACGTTSVQFDPVPSSVKLAVLLQASRWVKRREAPFGIAGSPEMGNELRLLAKLDPDVMVLLAGHGELHRYGTTG